ncbi:MAG: hypothetical protein AAF990_17960 [Bacteroidota bacterium]
MKILSWIKHWKARRDAFILNGVESSKPLYGRFFRKHSIPWEVDKKTLLAMPPGCLGYALGQFLKEEKLELMPKFEDHDVMHVLLNYPTTVADEVRMQCFLLGNGKKSAYALLAVVTGLLLMPEQWRTFREAYRRGRRSMPCHKWDFRYLLKEPLLVLQNQLSKSILGEEAPVYY